MADPKLVARANEVIDRLFAVNEAMESADAFCAYLKELNALPTIQRMEASEDTIRGNVDSLMKLVAAFHGAGIELIPEGATSPRGGRGVRLRSR